jgi:hypothetical protein
MDQNHPVQNESCKLNVIIQNMLTFPTASISLLPDVMDTVSEVANAKGSYTGSEKLVAHCFKTSRR